MAWIHATEVARLFTTDGNSDSTELLIIAYRQLHKNNTEFFEKLREAGWNPGDIALTTRVPKTVVTLIESGDSEVKEGRKDR